VYRYANLEVSARHIQIDGGEVEGLALVRTYRDCLGCANRTLARVADRAILMVAGLPLDLRSLQTERSLSKPQPAINRRQA
jgi:hypothetical protein